MRKLLLSLTLLALTFLAISQTVAAQEEVTVHPNQLEMLASADAQLAANKKLVFDFWVNVLIPGNDSQAGSLITRPSITGSIFTTLAVVT